MRAKIELVTVLTLKMLKTSHITFVKMTGLCVFLLGKFKMTSFLFIDCCQNVLLNNNTQKNMRRIFLPKLLWLFYLDFHLLQLTIIYCVRALLLLLCEKVLLLLLPPKGLEWESVSYFVKCDVTKFECRCDLKTVLWNCKTDRQRRLQVRPWKETKKQTPYWH